MKSPGGVQPGGPISPSPQRMTPKQFRAYLAFLRTHHFTPGQRRAFNAKKRRAAAAARRAAAKARRKTKLALPGQVDEGWICGGNDCYDSCAAVAVACSLLACTGVRLDEEQVLALHVAAAGCLNGAASVPEALHAAGVLAGAEQLCAGEPLTGGGLILDLDLQQAQRGQDRWDWQPSAPWGPHAVVLLGRSVVCWGREIPVTTGFLEQQVAAAWRVRWELPDAPQLNFKLPAGLAQRPAAARAAW